MPRRATPRTRVPAGSVGLAGPFAGAYPRASPGGWQLVGRTDAVLFDVDRDPPALLAPGARVRFRRGGLSADRAGARTAGDGAGPRPRGLGGDRGAALRRRRPRRRRPGQPAGRQRPVRPRRSRSRRAGCGCARSGPCWWRSPGRRRRSRSTAGPHRSTRPLTLRPGAELVLGLPPVGLRSYLAVRGGIDVPEVLGSRSTDTLSGLGPAPLRAGRRPPGRCAGRRRAGRGRRGRARRRRPPRSSRVLPGPRRDWLQPAAWTALTSAEWTVSRRQRPGGLRLAGPRLDRARDGRAAQRGPRARGDAGAAGRRPGAVPRRPSGDRRLSGAGVVVTRRPAGGRPAPARGTPSGSGRSR